MFDAIDNGNVEGWGASVSHESLKTIMEQMGHNKVFARITEMH
jgi:hypothetical protein